MIDSLHEEEMLINQMQLVPTKKKKNMTRI